MGDHYSTELSRSNIFIVEAAEQEDYDLAQDILNGARISLPTGGHAIHNLMQ